MAKTLTDIHNGAVKDFHNKKFNPPNSVGDQLCATFGLHPKSVGTINAQNRAYSQGRKFAKSQS